MKPLLVEMARLLVIQKEIQAVCTMHKYTYPWIPNISSPMLDTTFAFTYSNNVYFAEIILQESWHRSGQQQNKKEKENCRGSGIQTFGNPWSLCFRQCLSLWCARFCTRHIDGPQWPFTRPTTHPGNYYDHFLTVFLAFFGLSFMVFPYDVPGIVPSC